MIRHDYSFLWIFAATIAAIVDFVATTDIADNIARSRTTLTTIVAAPISYLGAKLGIVANVMTDVALACVRRQF